MSYKYALDEKITSIVQSYYSEYRDKEYFSGFALSVYVPGEPIKNYYRGTVSHDKNSTNVDDTTLFEIGSITKSFTSAIILQLEEEQKLKLTDTLGSFLPQYAKWAGLSLTSLLNMTSALPNYSNTKQMILESDKNPERQMTHEELIDFAYPASDVLPSLYAAYNYTNTGYILADMIIQQVTQQSFKSELEKRLFKVAELNDTFYPIPNKSPALLKRLASGYSDRLQGNTHFYHQDVKTMNLSWAGAAGGIVSNATDVTKWVKALFIDNKILMDTQKKKMMGMVSMKSGSSISHTSQENPTGYGLGVVQYYNSGAEPIWLYEGATIGFRSIYIYSPINEIIISAVFNSVVDQKNDHVMELITNVYMAIVSTIESFKNIKKSDSIAK